MKSNLILFSFGLILSGFVTAQNKQYDNGFEYFQQREYKKAFKEFSNCNTIECKNMACSAQINLGEFEKAIDGLIELKTIDTNLVLSGVDSDIGLCFFYLEQFDSAIYYYKREVSSSNFDIKFSFYPNFYIGKSYYYLQNYDSSTVYFEKCILMDSTDLDCNYFISKSYWFQNKPEKCFEIIDYTLSNNPKDISFLTLRGFLMFDGEIEGGLEYYEKAILLGYKPKGIQRKIIRLLRKMKKYKTVPNTK